MTDGHIRVITRAELVSKYIIGSNKISSNDNKSTKILIDDMYNLTDGTDSESIEILIDHINKHGHTRRIELFSPEIIAMLDSCCTKK